MITITFEPTNSEQAAVLAKAMTEYLRVTQVGAVSVAFEQPQEEAPAKKPRAKKEAAPEPAPEQPAPAKAAVTLEQVRAMCASKSQVGKAPEVKQLLQKFGAAKLTDVDPAKFADLLTEVEAL